MSDLFEAAAQAEREAVRLLLPRLRSDEAIQRRHLNDAMTKAFGGSDADGRWTQRASFELLEHALAIHLQSSAQKIAAFGDVRALIDLSDRLPTQTVRSEDQIEWQQFSTPVDIAAVMTLLANVQPDDIVLEPSAGNAATDAKRDAMTSRAGYTTIRIAAKTKPTLANVREALAPLLHSDRSAGAIADRGANHA